jgi:hypothetical protein
MVLVLLCAVVGFAGTFDRQVHSVGLRAAEVEVEVDR